MKAISCGGILHTFRLCGNPTLYTIEWMYCSLASHNKGVSVDRLLVVHVEAAHYVLVSSALCDCWVRCGLWSICAVLKFILVLACGARTLPLCSE